MQATQRPILIRGTLCICRAQAKGFGAAQTAQQDRREITYTEEHLPQSRVRLTVTVPDGLCEQAYRRARRKAEAGADVPGFRKGARRVQRVQQLI